VASALREAGAEVADISVPGWTISEANMGALSLVDRDTFKQLFSVAVTLLRAGGQHKKVIITPLMRYDAENCCDDLVHCTNRGSNLNNILIEGLSTIETWINDQAYLKRVKNFHVVNPNDVITPVGSTKKDMPTFKTYWHAGPVHMTSTGYDKLVRGIVEEVAGATYKRSETQPPLASPQPPQIRGQGSIQGRLDLASRRQGWVSGNDTVAHHNYGEQKRGAGGSRDNRGQWRGQVQPIWQTDFVNIIVLKIHRPISTLQAGGVLMTFHPPLTIVDLNFL
jgi:hypothetical protein